MSAALNGALGSAPVNGPLILALVLFLSGLGVPVPGTLSLLAAGALVGAGVFEAALIGPLAMLAVVLGDNASYMVGRYGSRPLLGRLEGGLFWQRAERILVRWGAPDILLTRFLLTPLSLPVNLLAGSGRYDFRRFVLLAVAGEVIWVTLFGGLGYLFAESRQTIGAVSGNLSLWIAAIVLAVVGVYEVYECCRHHFTPAPKTAGETTTHDTTRRGET